MNKNDNIFHISVFLSIAFHLSLIFSLVYYQSKHRENILKIDMSLPALKSIEVDSIGMPNILKKDIDQMMERKEVMEEEKEVMSLPSKENILITKMKALKNLEDSMAKENYMKKIKLIKGLKISAGKEISAQKPDDKTQSLTSRTGSNNPDMSNEELFKYVDVLKTYIKKYWSIPNWFYAEGLNTVISLSLKEDGGIKEAKIYKSSGNDYFDNAAMKSIKDASPFPSPPKTLMEIADNDGLLITFP